MCNRHQSLSQWLWSEPDHQTFCRSDSDCQYWTWVMRRTKIIHLNITNHLNKSLNLNILVFRIPGLNLAFDLPSFILCKSSHNLNAYWIYFIFRSKYRASEMPQAFGFNVICNAYQKVHEMAFSNRPFLNLQLPLTTMTTYSICTILASVWS